MRSFVFVTALALGALLPACASAPGPAQALDLQANEGALARAIGAGSLRIHNKGPGYVEIAWSGDPEQAPDELEWTELPSWSDAKRRTRGDLSVHVRNGNTHTTVGFAVEPGTSIEARAIPASVEGGE